MGILRTNTLSGLETPTPVTGSVSFDGVGGTGLTLNSSDFAFGTGDFCVEGWFNVTDSSSIRSIFDTRTSDNFSTGFFIGINSSDEFYTYGFPAGIGVSNWMIPTPGQWNHFAVTRQSNTGRVFINGISVGVVNMGSTDYTQVGGTVGRPSTVFGSLYTFQGYISNLRVLKGTALYTGSFTPPSRELQPIGDTVLLCCNNSTSATAEATGKTITVNGNAVASTFSPGLVRDFTYGTQFDGVSRFDTQGYFVPPSGNTQNRYTLGLNEIVTSGLVLHLDAGNPFSYPATGVGTKWTDLSGNNNHGTLTNGVSYTDNNRGALVFDGVDDYVSVPYYSLLDLGTQFTISSFIKLNNLSTTKPIFAAPNVSSGVFTEGYIFYYYPSALYGMDANTLRFQFGQNNWAWNVYASNGISITDNNWHFVSVTASNLNTSNPTITFYIDGNSITGTFWNASSKAAIRYSSDTSSVRVASTFYPVNYDGPYYLNGNIGQASIYNRALSAAEVSQNYEALKGRYGLP